MRKFHILFLAAATFFATQTVLADEMMTDSSSCRVVAKACLKAGYAKKKFWDDCMHPVLVGKTVAKVKLDATTVDTCRADKIAQMKKLLKELEAI